MELEWDKMSKNTFKMSLIPYFRDYKCSVEECKEKARYECKYKIKMKEEDIGWYSIDPIITFYLCNEHEQEEFLKLKYGAVNKETNSYGM